MNSNQETVNKLETNIAWKTAIRDRLTELEDGLKLTITNLRRLRDEKPEQWEAIADADLANCWDTIKVLLGPNDPKSISVPTTEDGLKASERVMKEVAEQREANS